MPYHHGLRTFLYQIPINISIGFIPFFCRKRINTCKNMLISFIHPISWKMFDSNSHTAFICSLHIFQGKIQHLLWITSKSSYIGNWIVKIIINIHNRRKRPVQPQSCTLFAGGISHSVSIFRIICSRHCHRFSEGSSLIGKSVSACFRISRK